jgi:hypothetical protein
MRRFAGTLVGSFAQLMAAGWLAQAMLPALCCCCCLGLGNTAAYGSHEAFYFPTRCCCETRFDRYGVPHQGVMSHSVTECRGACCTDCESYDCHRNLDGRQSTLRRRQLDDSEQPTARLVLLCLDVLSDRDSHWPSPTLGSACDKVAALSAAERCISLQRLLL